MFERATQDDAAMPEHDGADSLLVFVGSALVFPNSILRIADQETGGVRAVRLDTVDALLSLAKDPSLSIRQVFFDDSVAGGVFRDIERLKTDLPEATWVLAYRNPAIARRLLSERARAPRLSGILLLPMNLPICPWSSMLRLVLSGQFIASGDLMGLDAGQGGAATAERRQTGPVASTTDRAPMAARDPADRGLSGHGLTRREKEVLALVSQGGRNKTIAHKLSLSEHTVKLHLHHAITKIGARNRTEAATWYLSRQMREEL